MKLLSVGNDAKTVKGEKYGYLTGILYLSPADEIPGHNLCSHASPGCRAACLYTAGRGNMGVVKAGRERKTRLFLDYRGRFIMNLAQDIENLRKKAKRLDLKPVVRLNGTSDLSWEKIAPELFSAFPDVQFMDYSKNPYRMKKFLRGKLPENYHLTFSRSEINDLICDEILTMGGQVAVVFAGKKLPAEWKGFPVHDGDKHDARFSDQDGVIGLISKGKASKDETGFVIG